MKSQVTTYGYPDILKDFSLMIRLKGGRQLHQLSSNNLPIPSTASTDKYLADMEFITEGRIQVRIFPSMKVA